jgi:hypothetical protein
MCEGLKLPEEVEAALESSGYEDSSWRVIEPPSSSEPRDVDDALDMYSMIWE